MMPGSPIRVNIPPALEASLKQLSELGEKDFDITVEVLSTIDLGASEELVSARVAERGPEGLKAQLPGLIGLALSLRRLLATSVADSDQVAAAIARTYSTSQPDVNEELLSLRLSSLLDSKFVVVREKIDRLSEVGNPTIEEFQIVTDIRPIFALEGDDPGDAIGFLLVHTLTIATDEETRHFLLDSDDLRTLQMLAGRALKKAERSVKAMTKSDLPDLTRPEEDS